MTRAELLAGIEQAIHKEATASHVESWSDMELGKAVVAYLEQAGVLRLDKHTGGKMKLKAELGHWSSVVGGGVHLLNEQGHMVGQVMFICHTDEMRGKEVQMPLAKIVCDAINAASIKKEPK